MHNLDWDNIRYFLAVVRSGSVSRAAEQLGVNQTTVSRRIATLEQRLGKTLFDRTGSGFVITPVAERLVASAKSMAEEASAIERHVLSDRHELSGELRVTVADICTQHLAIPAIQAFTQQYPDDGTTPCITWLGDGHTRPPWIEKSFPKTRRVYRSTELNVMYQMTRQGIGMAQMPCALCDLDPLLHRIACRYVEPGWGLWVLSHVDLRTTARVRIFRDFLVGALEQQKDLIEGRSETLT